MNAHASKVAGDVVRILAEVAQKHGLAVDRVIGPDRDRWAVAARREAAERLYGEIAGASAPFVGRCIRRHHTTVLYLLGMVDVEGKEQKRKLRVHLGEGKAEAA